MEQEEIVKSIEEMKKMLESLLYTKETTEEAKTESKKEKENKENKENMQAKKVFLYLDQMQYRMLDEMSANPYFLKIMSEEDQKYLQEKDVEIIGITSDITCNFTGGMSREELNKIEKNADLDAKAIIKAAFEDKK